MHTSSLYLRGRLVDERSNLVTMYFFVLISCQLFFFFVVCVFIIVKFIARQWRSLNQRPTHNLRTNKKNPKGAAARFVVFPEATKGCAYKLHRCGRVLR